MHARLALVSAAVGLMTVGAAPAMAMTMVQSQEMTQSTSSKTSVSCTGGECSGSAEASSSQTGFQRQMMTTDTVPYHTVRAGVRPYKTGVWAARAREGQVRLTWGFRGDTCHVRYTEARESSYKYTTSASCDDGGVTIGGLVPGVKYRFQVQQGTGYWSKPVVVLAR